VRKHGQLRLGHLARVVTGILEQIFWNGAFVKSLLIIEIINLRLIVINKNWPNEEASLPD
jgi:hypothetical protein